MKIGHGYDAHRLIEGSGMILGGVPVASNYSIDAHSDGDLIVHALVDALLGAAGLGDIGTFYPSNDNKFKDISSRELLRDVVLKLKDGNYSIQNVDITFIGQEPKLNEFIGRIKENLSQDLCIEIDSVNCKATTTDFLGFEGEKKGLSCHAVALID
jgi:2-C-methyl-D-erythritol 2,4-cyclodiphosphate synthase|tara:strand:- start:376 stop:843 length:468 start_codon:yes stop_codon:yes gene_type:complete